MNKVLQRILNRDFAFIIARKEIQEKAKNMIGKKLSRKELKQVIGNLQTLFDDWKRDEIKNTIGGTLAVDGDTYGIHL